jgi:hypothetical protein
VQLSADRQNCPPDDNENWLKPDGAAMLRLNGDEAAGEEVRLLAD